MTSNPTNLETIKANLAHRIVGQTWPWMVTEHKSSYHIFILLFLGCLTVLSASKITKHQGFQTHKVPPQHFPGGIEGKPYQTSKSGWPTYWPRFKPGTTPNIGSLLYVFTASHCLCYTPCPLIISSPPCCLLHRLSLLNEVICSH